MMKMMRSFTFVIAAMLIPLAARTVALQPSTVVIKRILCQNCGIAIDTATRLGDLDGPGEVDANPWLSCSSKHLYAATKSPLPKEVLLFDSTGRFLKTIGRSGAGPGEFRRAFPIRFGPGDTLSVFDLKNARKTVIGPHLNIVRMSSFPYRVIASVPVSNGDVVMYSPIEAPEAVGLPLHLVDETGKLLRSFGANPRLRRADDEVGERRRLAPNKLGVWSSFWNDYRLEEWSTSGKLVRALAVPTPWFPRGKPRPRRGAALTLAASVEEDDRPSASTAAEARIDHIVEYRSERVVKAGKTEVAVARLQAALAQQHFLLGCTATG